MDDNVQRVRRGNEAFARADLDAIRETLHPDMDEAMGGSITLPDAGRHEAGVDLVRQLPLRPLRP